MKKLPESEQEIMMIVWEYAEPVSRFQIEEKLNVEKNIALCVCSLFSVACGK